MRAATLAAFILLAPASAGADDAKLAGLWTSLDQPGKMIEFSADGTFRYLYDLTPPRAVLQLKWKLGWFGKITLSQENGAGARSCAYKVEGDTLTFDDGSGHSCIPNEPVKMAQRFTRAK
jgi:hypothetical protein